MARLTCPKCQCNVQVPDKAPAVAVRCPECDNVLIAPKPVLPAFGALAQAATPSPGPVPPQLPRPAVPLPARPIPPAKMDVERVNEDEPASKKSRSRIETDRDRPARTRDEEEQPPRARRGRRDEEEERPRRREADDRDDEDDRPRAKQGRRDEEDEEDDRPRSRRGRDEEDDDDEDDHRPRSKRGRRNSSRSKDQPPFNTRRLLLVGGGVVGLVVVIAVVVVVGQFLSGLATFSGKWPEPQAPARGPQTGPTLTLRIAGVDEDTRDVIESQLVEHLVGLKTAGTWEKKTQRMVVWMSPAPDAEEFAKKIRFGKVYSVQDTIICVYAQKAPPAPTEPVARAIYHLSLKNHWRRTEAAQVLAKTPPDPQRRAEVARALEALIDTPDGGLQQSVIEALAVWGTPETVPLLFKLVLDPHIGPDAIRALGRLKDPRAIEPIAAGLDNFFTREPAKEELIRFGAASEPAMVKYLEHKDGDVRLTACQVLAKIGTRQCLPALEKATGDSNGLVAAVAKEAITAVSAR